MLFSYWCLHPVTLMELWLEVLVWGYKKRGWEFCRRTRGWKKVKQWDEKESKTIWNDDLQCICLDMLEHGQVARRLTWSFVCVWFVIVFVFVFAFVPLCKVACVHAFVCQYRFTYIYTKGLPYFLINIHSCIRWCLCVSRPLLSWRSAWHFQHPAGVFMFTARGLFHAQSLTFGTDYPTL